MRLQSSSGHRRLRLEGGRVIVVDVVGIEVVVDLIVVYQAPVPHGRVSLDVVALSRGE
jgi:hypothetical protein